MVVSQGSSPAIKSFSMPSDAASPNPADLDRELVKRAQAGDTASFDQLVVKYSQQAGPFLLDKASVYSYPYKVSQVLLYSSRLSGHYMAQTAFFAFHSI